MSYHHVLLSRHAVLSAAGAPVESMYTGPMAIAAFPAAARLAISAAIVAARPGHAARLVDLADLSALYGPRCAPLLGRNQALHLCAQAPGIAVMRAVGRHDPRPAVLSRWAM